MVLELIIANAAVFLLWKIADTDFMVKNFLVSSSVLNWLSVVNFSSRLSLSLSLLLRNKRI